ncbi:HAMP domain-containing sensor histidine kinase [Roseiarcus sp.]|uniref:HAMP domain-containing sensor histidine kinase n=1 Tax=Roseiarcus sp. TaxID=1969460 RepID=UPI003F983629
MQTVEVFRAPAFRLALAFCFAVSAATAAAFGVIYLQVSNADVQRVSAVLVDEAAKSEGDSDEQLRRALELRLTRDIRRLDYVALFDASGAKIFGDVPAVPSIPVDGAAHIVRQQLLPDSSGFEPALFVARQRPDGAVVLFGRSLREVYDLQATLLTVLAIALLPTVLVILAIGAFFARRASMRFERIHSAILRIMNGELHSRLPVGREGDDVEKVARAVNLMLDEIERLLDQLKWVGDNIAHDLRTPLMIARAKIARALDEETDAEILRPILNAAVSQIDRASVAIAAILRVSAVENGALGNRFTDFDLGAVCAEVVDFYEPLAQSKSIEMTVDVRGPAPMRGDVDLMREAVSNLVDNAIKFTPEGGTVRVEAETIDGLPRLAVSDTGRGIPPQDRARVFRRFFRGDGDDVPGHGLGLNIAQTIANLHGFQLTVEDNNPGARFVMAPMAKASLGLVRAAE